MASQISAARVQALEREQAALALRRQGRRYEEIAAQLGLSTSGAWKLVRRVHQGARADGAGVDVAGMGALPTEQ